MIDPAIARWLEPLERYEAMRKKFVRLGERVVDLAYPNPRGALREDVRAVLERALSTDRTLDFQYTPYGGLGPVRRAVADHHGPDLELPLEGDDVVLTPGAMAALNLAMRTFAPGEVIIPVPCWLDQPLYAQGVGLTPRLLTLPAPSFRLDPDQLRAAIGPSTRALVLTQPGNPSGVSHTAAELEAIAATLRDAEDRYGTTLTILSDETHRDLAPKRSPAKHWPRTLVVYSFGKAHHIQGQRAGYVAVSPTHPERAAVRDELVRWARITGTYAPTTLMQRAIPGLLALETSRDTLAARRAQATRALEDGGYTVCRGDGTFFLYARSDASDDFAFVESLAMAGVLVLPAPIFHHAGWFRIALTQTDEALERGLARLTAVRR